MQGMPGHMSDPQQDMRDKVAADMAANESVGWVDKANGIAKIPVSEAMKIIAEQHITITTSSGAPSPKGSKGAPTQGEKKP